jgi:hypothetical protein
MKVRAGWSEKQRVEHGMAPQFAVISGVPRADDLTDDELARIASRGLDGEEPPRRRDYVVDEPPEMTPEEWVARYAPADRR